MNCETCGHEPIGVTMYEGMEEWRCPMCGTYNDFEEAEGR